MGIRASGDALRIATAIPDLEAHPAYAISFSNQTRAGAHARQTTSVRWAMLALILLM